jgi:hypothetical protein
MPVVLAMCAGCFGGGEQILPDRATASGTVTLDGEPLPAGTIGFMSAEGPVATAVAILEDGTYLTNRAPIGKNVVTIDTTSIQVGNPPKYVPIPEKYRDPATSGLTVELQPGENEHLDFALKK